jgi:lipoate---protein ligase
LTWVVSRSTGSPVEFHARELPSLVRREVWLLEPDRAALVIGSAQPEETVDHDACARAGVAVVRRRSGGGAVLLVPGEVVWIDVIVPAGDALWLSDIGGAAHWLGEVWATALAACGVVGGEVHRGGLVRAPWSDVVCFAGLGPGEVTVGGQKVVGISQRRTRAAARFQCAVPVVWDPAALVALLTPPRPTVDELAAVALGVAVEPGALASAFVAALLA